MLARGNRVVAPEDFRTVVRRGRRVATPTAVYYRLARGEDAPLRLGFIISRAVGGAVDRNLLRRRWRAIGRAAVDAGVAGADVVVRALPGAAQRTWGELDDEFTTFLRGAS